MLDVVSPEDRLASDALGLTRPYRTAQAVVADRLRRAIHSGQLQPGQRLLQAQVAQEMRTSTTPVREALRELAGQGLLDLDPHRGVVVHQCQMSELQEIYRVRMLLEPVAIAATVQRISDEQIAAADRLLTRMERADDIAEWVILNAAFHSLLAEASRLPILTSILRKLRNISALYVATSLVPHPDRIGSGNAEHRALLRAIRERDDERAKEAELAHLRSTLEIGSEQYADATTAAGSGR